MAKYNQIKIDSNSLESEFLYDKYAAKHHEPDGLVDKIVNMEYKQMKMMLIWEMHVFYE